MKKFLLFALIFSALALYAKSPKVGEIFCDFDNQHLFVSFAMQKDFLTPEILEAVNSTKDVTFTYEIEAAKKRFWWFDKTTHRVLILKTVTYDNLTRQYEIVTTANDEEKEKKSLMSVEEVEKELGEVNHLDMGSVVDLSPGEKIYYVRVRVTLLKGFVLWIIPSDVDTGWVEKDLKTP